MASQKLGRTIEELEHAFSDWDALGVPPKGPATARNAAAKKSASPAEKLQAEQQLELRKKTRKLLNQLRKQLNSLNE